MTTLPLGHRIRRQLKIVLFSFIALLLVIMATITALLKTESGSRWAVTAGADMVGVALGEVHGNLFSGLDIDSVAYSLGEGETAQIYSAQQVSFRWRPISLWYGALSIQALSAQQIRIQLPVAQATPADSEPFSRWPALGLPLRIELGQIKLQDIQLRQGESLQAWQALSGSLSLGTFHLRYNKLRLEHQDYGFSLSGRTGLAFPYDTDARIKWHFAPVADTPSVTPDPASAPDPSSVPDPASAPDPTAAPVASPPEPMRYEGVAQLKGDLNSLHIAQEFTSPVVLKAEAQVQWVDEARRLLTEPLLKLALEWDVQTLPAAWWAPEQPVPTTAGQLTAEGTWNNYSAQLQGSLAVPELPPLSVTTQVQGDLTRVHINELVLREILSAPVARAASSADDGSMSSSSAASATTEQALVDAQSAASGLDENAYTPDPLATLKLSGDVQWSPALQGQLAVETSSLNLAQFISDWPSRINGRFTLTASHSAQRWRAEVKGLGLSGSLRGRSLEAAGGLGFDGERWFSPGLAIIFGANQLHLSGSLADSLNDSLDVQWELRAPLLNQFDSGLEGSLSSSGKIHGTWQLPQVSLKMDLQQFAWGAYALEDLQLKLQPLMVPEASPKAIKVPGENAPPLPRISLQGDKAALLEQQYQLDVTAKKLRAEDQQFSLISLTGKGSITQHDLAATVKSASYGKLDVGLAGQYVNEVWQAQLRNLDLRVKKVPRWWLSASKPLQVSKEGFKLEQLCLTTSNNLTSVVDPKQDRAGAAAWYKNYSPVPARYSALAFGDTPRASPVTKLSKPQLCLSASSDSVQGLQVRARLDSVPLRQFYALFKTEAYFAGVMDGSLRIDTKTFALKDLQASADISTREAELRYQYAGGGTETYPWRDFGVKAQLRKGILDANLGMEWLGYGKLSAVTQVDLQQQLFTKGSLKAQFDNLAPLETLLSFANDVQGDLHADMNWRGSLQKPEVQGQIKLQKGSLKLPRLGLDLAEVNALLSATPDGQLTLASSLQSGGGSLKLQAVLDNFASAQWQLQGDVTGDAFQVINLPQLKAKVSPTLQLSANPQLLELKGSALIPWARTNIKTLPQSAVRVSDDVVIIDQRQTIAGSDKSMVVHTNINLALGDDVSFKGFGLTSKLSGKLNLLKDAQRQLLTTGFVSVDQGSYKAYGQNLTVERGRLIFQGSYENPGLDIRAARDITNAEKKTKVGLEIGGTLQRPRAKVFSIPSYSDSEAMMMLLTGKPISEASKADASMLLGALSGLGVESEGAITADIAQFFRIDELEIKSDKGFDQSELWVGKYLTPKLLVRYVVGIFDSAFSLGVRYQLTEKLRLEAESGEVQSVDLIYKIER